MAFKVTFLLIINDIQPHDELLDIVDSTDTVVRTELRSAIYQQKLRYFRAVNAFIINGKGQLWIPRRTASKALFPLALDTSFGGHVQSGQSYEQALFNLTRHQLIIRTIFAKIIGLPHLS